MKWLANWILSLFGIYPEDLEEERKRIKDEEFRKAYYSEGAVRAREQLKRESRPIDYTTPNRGNEVHDDMGFVGLLAAGSLLGDNDPRPEAEKPPEEIKPEAASYSGPAEAPDSSPPPSWDSPSESSYDSGSSDSGGSDMSSGGCD